MKKTANAPVNSKKENSYNELDKKKYFSFNEVGDSVSGELQGFFRGQFGLVVGIGDFLINVNKTALIKIFRDYREKLKAGGELEISFIEEVAVKNSKKNKVKIFSVVYNGEQLISNDFALVEDLSDAKFNDLFN
jgi:hypothetical protein